MHTYFSGVYQEILVFYYFKNIIVPQNGENAYLAEKSQELPGPTLAGLQPIGAHFIRTTALCGVGKKVQNFRFQSLLYKKLATALIGK